MSQRPVRAEDVEPEAVEWLWRERIPRSMITVVAGQPDQGKGLFCVHVGAEISNSKIVDPITGKKRFGQVLHSAIEDSHGLMTRPRYEAAGANLKNIHLWRFQIPAMMSELEAIVQEKHIDLLVLDPFNAHLSQGVSRHSDSIRKVITPLTEFIERTKTAVIVVEHALKRIPQNGNPLQAIGGNSSGLVAASRMAFVFGVDPTDEESRFLCHVKGNIRDKPDAIQFETDVTDLAVVGTIPSLIYKDEMEFDPMRLFDRKKTDAGVGRPPDKRAAAAEWLTNYLWDNVKDGGMLGKQIQDAAKAEGMATKTLRRAAADMGIVKDPVGGGPKCKWSLPDEVVKMCKEADDQAKADVTNDDGEVLVPGKLTQDDIDALLGDGPVTAADVEVDAEDDEPDA
jgi:hypothetical protein